MKTFIKFSGYFNYMMKDGEKKVDFIKWFSELNKNSGDVAGGKGANLAEIYNLGVLVPQGFVITAQAYNYFIEKAKLKDKMISILEGLNYEDTEKLDKVTAEIRSLIVNSKIPEEMSEEILEAYEQLGTDLSEIGKSSALDILKRSAEPTFVAVRSSATAEDLAEASFAGQQDSFLNIKGNYELLVHVKKCFASLFTSRATYYRHKQGFKHEKVSLAVVIQKMVDSDKSGVLFSKDPAYKKEDITIEAVWGLGEGIVSGKITPDHYVISRDLEILEQKIADKKIVITRDSGGKQIILKLREEKSNAKVLTDYEMRKLTELAIKLEKHYKKPQDIEFAIEGNDIFITQTRPITTMEKRIDESLENREVKGTPILTGLAASPGIASGKVKIVHNLKDLQKINVGDILVTKMTNPDMVVTMQKSAAIVTDEGGLTAHASIVSREMGIPAIVGTQNATTQFKDGDLITVDGFSGKIYSGKTAEDTKKEILPVTAKTKTKVKVIVDLPNFASRAAKTGISKIGLTRIEGIIAESGKHPEFFLKQNKIKEYEEIIFKGINTIMQYFDEIWVRTSDIRSDEFNNLEGAPKEIEANPMLGFHGIRYSLKNPEILKAEFRALQRIASKEKTVGLLLPQVISVEEVQGVKKILKEINFNNVKVGVMIETPAAVQIIKDLCTEGIDFISFGTNDLTQYMLAVDRGNKKVQYLYNEMHPSVLYQLEYVIRVCKRNNVETSICGQAGSQKEMVKFLVHKNIDSISVNADVAKEISDYIFELEENKVKGTDEEPRQYQPSIEDKNIEQNLEKDIQAIEKEKQEYLKTKDNTKKTEEKPEFEKPQKIEENEDFSIVEDFNKLEEDLKAIEKERKEYIK